MSNEWIEWKGGECPVEVGTLVDVRYRNGEENFHVEAGIWIYTSGSDPEALAHDWIHDDNDYDIIAYRLHQPEPVKSWHDLGEFPPAGTVCEVFGLDDQWHETFIVGMDDEGYCVFTHYSDYAGDCNPANFRPLQK